MRADYLLIDVSNSFTKLAFATTKRVARPTQMPTRELTRPRLTSVIRRHPVRAIVVSSVVPKQNALIRKAAGRTRVLFIDAKTDLGVGVDYPQPKTIGADRLATIDGLVASWLPGSEGEGVADVLFGRRPFTGKLPVTWPATAAQEPINVGEAGYHPAFPYGYGLRTR